MTDWQTIAINALAGIKAGKNFIDMLKNSDATKVDVAALLQFADQFATAEVAIDSLKAELLKKEAEIQKLKEDMVKMPRCPKCGKPTYHFISSRKHMDYEINGLSYETWTCDACGLVKEVLPDGLTPPELL